MYNDLLYMKAMAFKCLNSIRIEMLMFCITIDVCDKLEFEICLVFVKVLGLFRMTLRIHFETR